MLSRTHPFCTTGVSTAALPPHPGNHSDVVPTVMVGAAVLGQSCTLGTPYIKAKRLQTLTIKTIDHGEYSISIVL